MRTRTLERLRWLSVLCLAGAAICFMLVDRRTNALERGWAHFPSPAPGMPVRTMVDVQGTARYQVRMDTPLPLAARHDVHFPDLPSQPADLRLSIGSGRGAAKTVDIGVLHFCSESGGDGIATFCSEPFEMASGQQDIEVSVADDGLPPGRALSIVEIGEGSGFLIVQDFMRFFGWAALWIGGALWAALAFARRYAASDAPR